MPNEPSIAEETLKGLAPRALDADFLARLVASAEGSLEVLGAEDIEMENRLRALRPQRLQDERASRLLALVGELPFAVDEKIVLFNRNGPRRSAKAKPRFFPIGAAAAAAVAILGSLAAILLPGPAGNENIAKNPQPVFSTAAALSPANFHRRLRETRDEGVIWQSQIQPHRVYRLTFSDEFSVTNEHGETLQVEEPRVEYVIVPEKID